MNIQTTPVLRLLTDYSHSQTIYRLHTASLKLPPDYLNVLVLDILVLDILVQFLALLEHLEHLEHLQWTSAAAY